MLSRATDCHAPWLVPNVHQLTRGPNYLDRIFVSEPCYSVVKVVCSTIKSDHRAVIASASNTNITDLHKVKTQHQYRKHTPDQHAALLSYLSTVYQHTDT